VCHYPSRAEIEAARKIDVKLLVIGSSDTSGTTLSDPSLAWPLRVARELSEVLGEHVESINLPVVHVGPKAVPRVAGALERENPDIVVFAFGAYHFIVATVGQRVRRRYGERVYGLFRKLEVAFEGKTANDAGDPARLNRAGRWLARRIIGAETLSTEEEVRGIQLEVMRLLAQREGLIAVSLMAPPVAPEVDRENKGANRKLAAHREYMTGVARSHGFLIADCLPGFAALAAGNALRHSDGVHKGPEGHRIQGDAVLEALLSPPSPFAKVRSEAESLA